MSGEVMVAVIGDGQCGEDEARVAEEVGRELARRGITVVCGGLGGVMEAACRGAKSAGGRTVGIIPGDDPSAANRYVDTVIVTGMGEARNVLVVKTARAVIAVRGGYGTLSEIALALKAGRPVIGLGTWELRRNGVPDESIWRASSPAEAAEKAAQLARLGQR
ncbi:MAG: TIGR00725 family protein [Actinobacteria bacterium]|nr:TIGR00725 family protein [Actinomycetota bacterium]